MCGGNHEDHFLHDFHGEELAVWKLVSLVKRRERCPMIPMILLSIEIFWWDEWLFTNLGMSAMGCCHLNWTLSVKQQDSFWKKWYNNRTWWTVVVSKHEVFTWYSEMIEIELSKNEPGVSLTLWYFLLGEIIMNEHPHPLKVPKPPGDPKNVRYNYFFWPPRLYSYHSPPPPPPPPNNM